MNVSIAIGICCAEREFHISEKVIQYWKKKKAELEPQPRHSYRTIDSLATHIRGRAVKEVSP